MASRDALQQEVDKNYAAFAHMLRDLMADRAGKYALLRQEKLVDVFDTAGDAKKFAAAQYPDGLFSIQQITDRVVDLGYFSHAMHLSGVSTECRAAN